MDPEDGGAATALNELMEMMATHGPVAIIAGFLIWQVVKAWGSDRAALISMLTEFRETLDGLKRAVERLSERLERG